MPFIGVHTTNPAIILALPCRSQEPILVYLHQYNSIEIAASIAIQSQEYNIKLTLIILYCSYP